MTKLNQLLLLLILNERCSHQPSILMKTEIKKEENLKIRRERAWRGDSNQRLRKQECLLDNSAVNQPEKGTLDSR